MRPVALWQQQLRREVFTAWNFVQVIKDTQPLPLGNRDHFIGTLGRAANPEHRITAAEEALRDRMKNLIECRIADAGRAGERNEW